MVLIAVCFSACTSKDATTLSFYNGLEFKIEKGEKSLPIDELVKEEYFNLQKDATLQIPLYRFLKAKEYRLFIGIPYDTSFEQLANFLLPNIVLLEQEQGTNFIYKKYKKDNYYIAEYVYKVKNNVLAVFGVSYLTENIAFLSKENLSKRLKNTQDEK